MLDCNQGRGVSEAVRSYQAAINGVPDCAVAKRRFMDGAEKLFDLYWRAVAQPDSKGGAVSGFIGLPDGQLVRVRLSRVNESVAVYSESPEVEG